MSEMLWSLPPWLEWQQTTVAAAMEPKLSRQICPTLAALLPILGNYHTINKSHDKIDINNESIPQTSVTGVAKA